MKGKLMGTLVLALSAVIAWEFHAGAAEVVTVEKTVVTATRTESSVSDVPASVEIITADEIARMEGRTLTDVLKYATGMEFYSDMFRTAPSIRGMSAKHTLLLMDGKRMAGPLGKFNETERIGLENIERIEIIRGPMSTLYGSEAMGGVVNIITKKPGKVSVGAGIKYGAYDEDSDFTKAFFDLTLAGESMGKFGMNLSGQFMEANSLLTDENASLTPKKDLRSVNVKFTCDFTDALSSTVTLGYTEDEVENRYFSSYLRSSDNEYERFESSLALEYKKPGFQAMLRGYHSDYEKEYETRYLEDYVSQGKLYPAGQLKDFDAGERKTSVVEGQLSSAFAKNHLITLGGEWRREFHHSARMDTGEGNFSLIREGITVLGSECEPDNYAVYIQDEWSLSDKFLLISGLRYDEPDEFDSEVSPRIGITWFMRPDLRVKLNYGHSYVAPGPGQLYKDWYGMGGKYHMMGNRDLSPEVSDSYEIAIEGEKGRFDGRMAYFRNDVEDLIESVYSHNESDKIKAYVYRNIGEARIQGAEVEAGFSITGDIRFEASYACLDAVDKENDERLEQRAKNKFIAKLYYTNMRYDFDVNLWGERTMDYLDEDKNYDFTMVNLNLKKRLGKKVDLYAGVENLLDEKEEELHQLVAGTLFYGGVNLRF